MKASAALAVLCVVLLGMGTVLTGCSEDEDLTRSRVSITRVVAVGDQADDEDLSAGVLLSDVLNAGDDGIPGTADDFIYEDVVEVTVENEPSSSMLGLQPEGPFGSITVHDYRIDYLLENEQLTAITGGLHLRVPTGESAVAQVPVVTAYAKTQPPLSALAFEADELLGTAVITLYCTEQDSNDEIVATARIAVHFANWADVE